MLAALYGIFQGLTEFLPVSSSAHLALLSQLYNDYDPGVVFDLMMHVGTAFSVIIYYRKFLLRLITDFELKKGLILNLFISSLMTVPLALLFKESGASWGRSPLIISINLIVFGLIMAWFDRKKSKTDELKLHQKNIPHALLIGLFQSLAVFPGVSRSGITITAARALGISRSEATGYSFILSLPLILGGALLLIPEALSASSFDWKACFTGMVVSFVVGISAIHFLVKFVEKIGFAPFVFYRVVLGVVIIVMTF